MYLGQERVRARVLQAPKRQGVVSEILNAKRDLNVRQIRALAKRFHVSPTVFI